MASHAKGTRPRGARADGNWTKAREREGEEKNEKGRQGEWEDREGT